MTTIAVATCREFADLDESERLVIAPLADRGVTAVPTVWDDPSVDWTTFDLVVVRSTWDYTGRRAAFLDWAASLRAVANPADVLAWNTDKRYLGDLAAAGVRVVETTWCGPGEAADLPADGEVVIKPSIGAGSVDAGRYDLSDAEQRGLAAAHVTRLQDRGATAMIQPYLGAVDEAGETAMLFFGGRFSHAIGKAALLTGPDAGVEGLFRQEEITPRTPTEQELALAETALKAVPGGADRLTYARVDVLPGDDGSPILLELELCEPSLFLEHDTDAAGRLADAVADRLT
jgi:hypothetical protein